jgi:DNA-binding transcriptional MocR family regulator
MPDEVRAEAVAMQLRKEGILVSTAEPFSMATQPPHAIRLALGSVSHARLKQALETVTRVVVSLGY